MGIGVNAWLVKFDVRIALIAGAVIAGLVILSSWARLVGTRAKQA